MLDPNKLLSALFAALAVAELFCKASRRVVNVIIIKLNADTVQL